MEFIKLTEEDVNYLNDNWEKIQKRLEGIEPEKAPEKWLVYVVLELQTYKVLRVGFGIDYIFEEYQNTPSRRVVKELDSYIEAEIFTKMLKKYHGLDK